MSSASVPIDQLSPELKRRFDRTLAFMRQSDVAPSKILDLGPDNTFAEILRLEGYEVLNTGMVDLDLEPEMVSSFDVDCITSFEIFEHLLAPFSVLRALPRVPMFSTVPLALWFASAYRHPSDEWDRHYHEFEDWQFDWLLEKSGWSIIRSEQWTAPISKLGVRPVLRRFWPRYYAVEAVPASN